MSDIKMQAPVGRASTKDSFSKTTPNCCRRRVSVRFSAFLVPTVLLLFSAVTPALSIHMESIESHSEFSCEPIRLRMCQDLPYNTTFMPNLLNHYDQQTAALAMEAWHIKELTEQGSRGEKVISAPRVPAPSSRSTSLFPADVDRCVRDRPRMCTCASLHTHVLCPVILDETWFLERHRITCCHGS
ncbi:Frizzled-3 [Liparis tanakae]|uniref:Frizzled-3 n=1 Tax=Liparis tanakae TaxID=230148 RepID=A0A4Z2FSP7_9TELE|nr:Frizzled-3 [Liparis tanakae]